MVITRFSPSPTGYLHIGNIRTALISYLFAKSKGGKAILRIDDTDFKRSKQEFTDQIIKDLEWLGLEHDELFKQSDRLIIYEKVKQQLIEEGRLYPCFETEEDLAVQRKIQLSRGVPPIYDRAALKLSQEQIAEKISTGEKPYYRFLLEDKEVSWQDGIRGEIKFKERNFSDPVLIRADDSPTYTFCSVIDDAEFGVTDIVRGEDHITNTAIQIQIFEALNAKIPNFHHLSLLKTKEGELSKRLGVNAIKDLHAKGIDNMAINSLLSRIGTSQNVVPFNKMADVVAGFDISSFSHGAIFFNEKDLLNLNHKILTSYAYSEIADILNEFSDSNIDEEFWNAIKENIILYSDIKIWQEILSGGFTPNLSKEDKDYLNQALDLIPDVFDVDSFKAWVKEISNVTGRKGKELYKPIRVALTNREDGPELSKLLQLLGRDKVEERLKC